MTKPLLCVHKVVGSNLSTKSDTQAQFFRDLWESWLELQSSCHVDALDRDLAGL